MKAFTLLEMLLVVLLISILLATGVAVYRQATWSARVTQMSMEHRGRINQAVAEGRIRDQKTLDRELRRAKRMTESGLKQGQ